MGRAVGICLLPSCRWSLSRFATPVQGDHLEDGLTYVKGRARVWLLRWLLAKVLALLLDDIEEGHQTLIEAHSIDEGWVEVEKNDTPANPATPARTGIPVVSRGSLADSASPEAAASASEEAAGAGGAGAAGAKAGARPGEKEKEQLLLVPTPVATFLLHVSLTVKAGLMRGEELEVCTVHVHCKMDR